MKNKKTLNILNGQCMYDYFINNNISYDGEIVPFNEAMCIGYYDKIPFSKEFIENRLKTHNVAFKQYKDFIIDTLYRLLKLDFDHIVLWFDADMFCQINMLTILAYLDYKNYEGLITYNLTNNEFDLLDSFDIDIKGYYQLYIDTMINNLNNNEAKIKTLENGINLYLDFVKEDNEIIKYIKENKELSNEELLKDLFVKFENYGVGDAQYIKLIQKVRGK